MANIPSATDATFEEKVLKSDIPVLVDFTAAWCGPCKAMAPAIEDLAREYEGEAAVYLVDIDENPDTRHAQGIMGVPTFMIFNRGELVERFTGSMSRSKLAAALEAAIEAAQ
ncbi:MULTISPECIES: thioredoxin [Sphingobium]|jgi:thioredoxin 1|uniref:Thioredoxin n=2 Tax=Sphingobium fuliginis (strain ATCC 27551) TaxID=336203 RepID=A0A292ZM70_SPHSA|nr:MULTISPECIES: thioredoxin [Sphingobium]QDC39542.1 thioredoxin [Sphingobium fuliginis ATCC 27551]QOT73843.1 thioredoxin [Sphingobium fuliginis]RYL96851.1 thioredoxin [Sphingobium fuliginis]WDA35916.1 thioredoxin [Sphingobium sp. YC-XJ3]GAY24016.1 thioredoxin [Sphingobium fuliginis]